MSPLPHPRLPSFCGRIQAAPTGLLRAVESSGLTRLPGLAALAAPSSAGTAVAVSDDDLLLGVRELSQEQGVYACPEGGAVWKAACDLVESGWLDPTERIVLFNTGSGLKYNHLFPPGELPVADHTDPNCLAKLGFA